MEPALRTKLNPGGLVSSAAQATECRDAGTPERRNTETDTKIKLLKPGTHEK